MNRKLGLALILIMAVSTPSVFAVKPASAQTVAVPTFTISTVSGSYVIPTTYSTNPYTGAKITNLGYTIASFNVTIRVQNSPPTTAYEVGVKGQYATQWNIPWTDEGNVTAFASSDSQTVITFYGSNESEAVPEYNANEIFLQFGGDWGIDVPFGGQLNFRLLAVNGENPINTLTGYVVLGNVSGWTPAQTVTVPDFSTVTVSPTPTSSPTLTPTVPEFLSSLFIIPLIISIISVAAIARRRRQSKKFDLI